MNTFLYYVTLVLSRSLILEDFYSKFKHQFSSTIFFSLIFRLPPIQSHISYLNIMIGEKRSCEIEYYIILNFTLHLANLEELLNQAGKVNL